MKTKKDNCVVLTKEIEDSIVAEEIFRLRVRDKLSQQNDNKDNDGNFIIRFLNLPSARVLVPIIVAVVSFLYGKYKESQKHNQKIELILSELTYRWKNADTACANISTTSIIQDTIKNKLDLTGINELSGHSEFVGRPYLGLINDLLIMNSNDEFLITKENMLSLERDYYGIFHSNISENKIKDLGISSLKKLSADLQNLYYFKKS